MIIFLMFTDSKFVLFSDSIFNGIISIHKLVINDISEANIGLELKPIYTPNLPIGMNLKKRPNSSIENY